MAKKSSESLRNQEREIETEAAYAGGGEPSPSGDGQYLIPKGEKVDDMKVAERVMDSADDEGLSSAID
jgi:hypothetical protein